MMIAGEAFILMNYDVVVKEKTMVFLYLRTQEFLMAVFDNFQLKMNLL